MIVGYLIIGILLGTISAAISLFMGSSVLWAIVIYCAVGGLGTFISAAIRVFLIKAGGAQDRIH